MAIEGVHTPAAQFRKDVKDSQKVLKETGLKESGQGRRVSENAEGVGVHLSKGGKDLQAAHQKAYEIAMNTPDVREDKVEAIKKQLKEGTYKIDSGKIADGMLREAIKDKLAMELGE